MENRVAKKRRYRIQWIRFLLFCLVMLLGTGVALGGAFLYYLDSFQEQSVIADTGDAADLKAYAEVATNRTNILIMGVDDGEYGAGEGQPKRSDTIMLLSIDPKTDSANILSIPRDTAVTIPGRKGMDKVGHAHAYGGPQLTARTVSQMLGVPIHHYVEADFSGFEDIVDILGGVELYVEQNMDYEDPYANLAIHLRRGFQHLDGDKAGQYVRFRHDELGDIGRVQRQQKFVQAVADKVFQPSTILKIPTLATTMKQYVKTDMSAMQMLRVANTVKGIERENIKTEMLPGNFGEIDSISYWVMDKEETKRVVKKLFKDSSKGVADTDSDDRTFALK